MDPEDQKLISLVDQIQAALKEVFKERGYDVEVAIPRIMTRGDDEGMGFTFDCKERELDEEIVGSVIEEAMSRIGVKGVKKEFEEDGDEWKN